ncbi:MAG: hypothetical protein COV30_00830 [Candidatus Yanofskybacteria bacterium CG10_big_fil_rev_8_21_14_0_10_37_15]|uniref:Uncharacterized protein n=1 Tax=Candidatus Yanofskybacteria bacterium CG10_big_fil_rev_8_21_14_0_10_37_15 TaxID=1975097 RepID=A0A2H0R631_9BACT|nr:MAG: hypothetical protein COV30_00830 [Candidatus Yanofskybacteria bacterium CG10_big_fil_rev_8_21_14_0_10_37_15]
MNLIINFTEKRGEIELILQEGKERIDYLNFTFYNNLDDLLISSVDKILKRNKINVLSLKTLRILENSPRDVKKSSKKAKNKIFFKNGVDKNSSSYRIVETFVKAIKTSK